MSLMFTPELQLYMFDYEWNGHNFSHAFRTDSPEEANDLPAAMSKGKFVGEVDEYPSGEESTTAGVLLSVFQFEYEYKGETRLFTIPADDKEEAIGRAAALANFKELGAYARVEEDSEYKVKQSNYAKPVKNYVPVPASPEPPQLWIQITIFDSTANLPEPRCQQVDADGRPNSKGRFLLVPLPELFEGDPMLERLEHEIEIKKLWKN